MNAYEASWPFRVDYACWAHGSGREVIVWSGYYRARWIAEIHIWWICRVRRWADANRTRLIDQQSGDSESEGC